MNDKRAKRLRKLARSLTKAMGLSPELRLQINQRTRVVRVSPACTRGAYLKMKAQTRADDLRRAYP